MATYRIDNTRLNSQTDGILYRFSKDLQDFDEELLAEWDSTVTGIDEGDGWLHVGGRYLPLQIRGVQVLLRLDDLLTREAAEGEVAKADHSMRDSCDELDACYSSLDLISKAMKRCERRTEDLPPFSESYMLHAMDSDSDNEEELQADAVIAVGGGREGKLSCGSPSLLLQYEWLSMGKVMASMAQERASSMDATHSSLDSPSPTETSDDDWECFNA
eukprot:TRINITY_DN24266_c0_g1_i1.p1 TRINITY_DN24266_c0_g1~~TRINITY_DN24266_c0_g1_i1.p1  ORF type:complete len:235 (+),score=55.48 TRINITY_DN24266_c0_g1_i1:57-707(+)